MAERVQGVLFDLDGTLLDTLGDLAASGNAVLRSRGLPEHEVGAYRYFIGSGMANLVHRIFPEDAKPEKGEALDAVVADYKAEYAARWQATTKPYEGVPELLDELADRGIPMGVVSNKSHVFTEQCVSAFLGNWRWQAVIGQRDGIPHKPDPFGALEAAHSFDREPGDCAFVGDSGIDMLTGVAAGMRPVGVLWGFREAGELRDAGSEVLLETPMELLALL